MIFYCLTPIDVADECALLEAVDWVALQRLPRTGHSDPRYFFPVKEDEDAHDDRYAALPENDQECCVYYYPMCECAKTGSPIQPLEESPGYTWRSEYEFEHLLSLAEDEDQRQLFITCKQWKARLKNEREPGMARVFLALREGKLDAFGIKLLKSDFFDNTQALVDQKKRLADIGFSPIPASFWSYEGIDWVDDHALASDVRYVRIYINVEQLLKVFPPPVKTTSVTFDEVAGYYVLNDKNQNDEDIELKVARVNNAGRLPKHDWDEIQSYIDQRLWKQDIPQKQDALVQEIRDWCGKNSMSVPSRSSLKERLGRIYKTCRAVE